MEAAPACVDVDAVTETGVTVFWGNVAVRSLHPTSSCDGVGKLVLGVVVDAAATDLA